MLNILIPATSAIGVIIITTGIANAVPALDPRGVWLIEHDVAAVEIYDCRPNLCGRLVWLSSPVDEHGRPRRDHENPDPAARDRPLCGLTVLDGMSLASADTWDSGHVYNPMDGHRYHASMHLLGDGRLEVRAYLGTPLLGKSQGWRRMPLAAPLSTGSTAECGASAAAMRSASR